MRLLALIRKDIKIILSDRKALLILIGMPIILFTILSFALQGSFSSGTGGLWDIDVAVVKNYDLDKDYERLAAYMSEEEARGLESIVLDVLESEDLSFLKVAYMDQDQAMKALEEDQLAAVIVLPDAYVYKLALNMVPGLGQDMTVQVVTNPEKAYSGTVVTSIVSEVLEGISAQMIESTIIHDLARDLEFDPQAIQVTEERLDLVFRDYKIDKMKTVTSSQYYSVAMMAMFILFGASYGSKFMLLEKRRFTLQRQQVAGLEPYKLLVGKMVVIFFIGLLQISAMILTSHLGFGVYWGQPTRVLLVTLLTAFAVMGFGTILAGMALRADSFKALNILESGVFQVIALFGGSYFPIFLMPDWFQFVSKVLLNGAALDVYLKLMMDAPVGDLLPGLGSLALNGLVFMSIGLWIINHKPNPKVRRSL